MKQTFLLLQILVMTLSLASQTPKPFFLPREDNPFYLFSPSGSVAIENTESPWPRVMKLRTSGDGANTQIVAQDLPSFDLRTGFLTLWIKTGNISDLNDFWIYFAQDRDFNDRIVFMISQDKTQLIQGEWTRVSLPLSSGQIWGAPDLTKITAIQFWLSDNGSNPVEVEIGPIMLEERLKEPAVVLTFDDGWKSQIETAAPLMARYNLTGTAYIIPELIGTPGYMSIDDLRILQDQYGWSIGTHEMSRLDANSPEELAALFKEQKIWFESAGLEFTDISYPNGAFSPDILETVPQYFKSARTIIEYGETNPPGNPYLLRTMNIVPEVSRERIDLRLENSQENGELLIFIFHKIEEVSRFETELSIKRFEEICRQISDSGIPDWTMAEVSSDFPRQTGYPNPDWNSQTFLQPRVKELSGTDQKQDQNIKPPKGTDPLQSSGPGHPDMLAGTQLDFSLDWRMVWGVSDDSENKAQYYNQLDDLHIYIQKELSDSTKLFSAVGIEDVNFEDFSKGAINGSDFYIKALFMEQEFPLDVTLQAGYFSPDPFHKWLQVTRSAGIESALGQDMTPQSLWLLGKWKSPGAFGIQAALIPDVIGKETETGEQVLSYQQALGIPNFFGSLWYDSQLLDGEIAGAVNRDALKIAAEGGLTHDFSAGSLSASLGYKYTRGTDFTTYPEWDHLDGANRLSTGWSFSAPLPFGLTASTGLAYQALLPKSGTINHRMGWDWGLVYEIVEWYGVITAFDMTDYRWSETIGLETGIIVDYKGVDYMTGYTMAGFNTVSGLYNNKSWNEGGVNGVFLRIKATYW